MGIPAILLQTLRRAAAKIALQWSYTRSLVALGILVNAEEDHARRKNSTDVLVLCAHLKKFGITYVCGLLDETQ